MNKLWTKKRIATIVVSIAFLSILTLIGFNALGGKESKATNECPGSQCPAVENPTNTDVKIENGVQTVTINVSDNGYSPNNITVKKGIPVKVTLRSERTYGCSRSFVVPSLNVQKNLPKTGEDSFEFKPEKTGKISFSCSMGMYSGQFIAE